MVAEYCKATIRIIGSYTHSDGCHHQNSNKTSCPSKTLALTPESVPPSTKAAITRSQTKTRRRVAKPRRKRAILTTYTKLLTMAPLIKK